MTDKCRWCRREVNVTSSNLVHVGGEPNDVVACDRYLKGEDCRTSTEELANKIFNEAGYPGNLYHQVSETVRQFENKALEIKGEG